MAAGSGLDSEKGWSVAAQGSRATALVVRLRQRTVVLPWALFLYAEGTEVELRAVFHTHLIAAKGAGLTSLLSHLADQTVTELIEPDRTARFSPEAGPHLAALAITENK